MFGVTSIPDCKLQLFPTNVNIFHLEINPCIRKQKQHVYQDKGKAISKLLGFYSIELDEHKKT